MLDNLQVRNAIDRFTLGTLRSLETTRHNHFGHGMQHPFSLSAAEVDFNLSNVRGWRSHASENIG